MEWNKYQSTVEELKLDSYPEEVQNDFWENINGVPFIRNLISKDRPLCRDLPRDEEGKAVIDITNPPIIEDIDYFRQTALTFNKTGKYTELKPNKNPNSEYSKWIHEEVRRCWEGLIRPEDGAYVTGDMYFYLNYSPIIQSKIRKGTKVADRIVDFPEFWEGILWRYIYQFVARENAHHAAEIAKRGASKSYCSASQLVRNFILGENEVNQREVRSLVMAYQKEYLTKDGTLNKFEDMRSFLAQNTQFPHKTLTKSMDKMQWKLGRIDLNTGAEVGLKNEVLGVSAKDDPDKARGKRASKIIVEEFGNFPKVTDTYRVILPSVQEGDIVFGQVSLIGTGGSEGNDFAGAQEIIYSPLGYNIQPVTNVYDKNSQGKGQCIYFFPAFINRKGCYNKDGISDVTKAVLELCYNRYLVKYNSSDPAAISRTKAENPITLQEAIMRRDNTIFPVAAIMDRIEELKANTREYDDVYTGELYVDKEGTVQYRPSTKQPIRFFPHKDNKLEGSIEIFKMPEKDKNGKVYPDRYWAGIDPYDDDESNTMSLGSIFILDSFTDQIVAEYTGRPQFADDFYEECRKLLLFYNARCNYEAHPYSQEVHMPNGEIKLWKDIKVGDTLLAPNGNTVKVLDIPVDEYMPIYKVILKDGREIMCNDGHLWNVLYKGNSITMSTRSMMNIGTKNKFNQTNFFIQNQGAVNYPEREVPISPYTFGLLLAEGAFTKFKDNKVHNKQRNMIQFSSSKNDGEFYKTVIPYETKYIGNSGTIWHTYIDNIDLKLKNLGLLKADSYNKFIPTQYLYNSYNVRLELLKGLMDGDGYAGKKGASIYVTASEQLCKDIMSLCRSLGINCSSKKVLSNYTRKSGELSYSFRISIYTDLCIFKLPRKVAMQHKYTPESKGSKANSFINRTAIKDIVFSHYEKGKCITVDNPNGLYLIGDYVTTHNCNKKGLFSYFAKMNCLYLLTDTLEFLKDKDTSYSTTITNKTKGTNATASVNAHARRDLRDWLLKPVNVVKEVNGEDIEVTVTNLTLIRNMALLQELSLWNPDGNYDRVSAMGMLMLLREDKLIQYGDNPRQQENYNDADDLSNDPFFNSLFRRGKDDI